MHPLNVVVGQIFSDVNPRNGNTLIFIYGTETVKYLTDFLKSKVHSNPAEALDHVRVFKGKKYWLRYGNVALHP